jgi:signal transduction histidine kinase
MKQPRYLGWYYRLFHWVAQERLKRGDVDSRQMHIHLIVVLSTNIFFWFYVILGHLTIKSPWAPVIGYCCVTVATLAPFAYRLSNKVFWLVSATLISGYIQIISHSYFTGGIDSFAIIWLAVLPLIAGIILGTRSALGWLGLCFSTAVIFLLIELLGYDCPIMISDMGYRLSRNLTIFSWILINTLLFYIFNIYRDGIDLVLQEQKAKIDDLFRVLFHDLANPLSRVELGLQLARKQANSPTTSKGIDVALQGTKTMLSITSSVKKMYAATHGKEQMELQYIDLQQSVDYVRSTLQGGLQHKGLSLSYDAGGKADLRVLVEEVTFNNQVLANLISNAIKFSHPGGKIIIKARDLNNGWVQLEVIDHGIGIPKELLEDIFKINKNTSRPGTQGESGSGFGLHIVKTFVEMYQGSLTVESHEGQGTSFKILLKARREKGPAGPRDYNFTGL